MFVQWITGENMYDEEEIEHLNRTAPPSKSAFNKKQFEDVNEWCKKFMQEAEFVEKINEIRQKAMLSHVTLAFADYKF